MKSEFQRQLESLGFKLLDDPNNKNKNKNSSNNNVNGDLYKKQSLGKKKHVKPIKKDYFSKVDENEAKKTIKRLYSNPINWKSPEFLNAYFSITGSKQLMDYEQAKMIVSRFHHFENRKYEFTYSVALLLLSGIWITPQRKPYQGMSKQIKARTERRDMNASYVGARVFNK